MADSQPLVAAIVAMAENRIIGKDGSIPWHLPEDLKHFSELTTGHSVLMGRKTYFSLPEKFRPLPRRKNIVVTRSPEALTVPDEVQVISSPEEFVTRLRAGQEAIQGSTLWIAGGGEIYRLTRHLWDRLYLTVVKGQHEGDTSFPAFENDFVEVECHETDKALYRTYTREE